MLDLSCSTCSCVTTPKMPRCELACTKESCTTRVCICSGYPSPVYGGTVIEMGRDTRGSRRRFLQERKGKGRENKLHGQACWSTLRFMQLREEKMCDLEVSERVSIQEGSVQLLSC
jgi:hypothetical protein